MTVPIDKFHNLRDDAPDGGPSEENAAENMTLSEIVFPADHPMCKLWSNWLGIDVSGKERHIPFLSPASSLEHDGLERQLTEAAQRRLQEVRIAEGIAGLNEKPVVLLSGDGMTAWLILFPALGEGGQLSVPEIYKQMVKQGVIYGVDRDLLHNLPTNIKRYFHLFPIAFGIATQPGQDGYIVDHYPREIPGTIEVDALGQADYTVLKLVQEIKEGQPICEIVPPTLGVPGRTVTGAPLPPQGGQAAVVPQGRNTVLSQDGRYLLAGCDGHLGFTGREFKVKPVLHLYEGDIKEEQSIKYLGDIHIHCDLHQKNAVCAMGTVQIDGLIEECTVEAGEHIIASSGVQGHGTTALHAQKNVYGKFLESCAIYAKGSIYADCIINSDIYSNGVVQARTGHGGIIGGTTRSACGVTAVTVGSKAERPTDIVLGGTPCEEAEQMHIQRELDRIEKELAQLEEGNLDASEQQRLSKLRLRQCVAQISMEKITKEMEVHRNNRPADQSCRLCCDTIYPGTTVVIGRSTYHITAPEHNCSIGESGGQVG